MQHTGHFVDGVHIPHANHAPLLHIGEEGDFRPLIRRHAVLGAAEQGIGLDADFTQLLHRVLGGFGFEFARRLDIGQIGQVDKGGVVGA